jgi:hypothetical protein
MPKHDTMVNALKRNISELLAGKYGKSIKQSTCQHHQANEGKADWEAELVRPLGALGSLRFQRKLSAEKTQEMYFLSNEEKEKWIED